jgi:hypothetical protein
MPLVSHQCGVDVGGQEEPRREGADDAVGAAVMVEVVVGDDQQIEVVDAALDN